MVASNQVNGCSAIGRRAFLAALALAATGAKAQSANPQFQQKLQRALARMQSGDPAYDDMEPMLADEVRKQWSIMRERLMPLGSVQNVEFRGIQSTGMGPAEYYRVQYQNGTLAWLINVSPSSGKILVLWTPG